MVVDVHFWLTISFIDLFKIYFLSLDIYSLLVYSNNKHLFASRLVKTVE